MATSTLINHACTVTYCGRSIVVTPRRRVVHGARHETVDGRRRYVVNCRFECEWVEVWTDSDGRAHIIVREGYFAAWQLERVGSMDYESERAA